MKKYLIVVDMQNDFIDGALGSKEAVEILPRVKRKIEDFDGEVIFTKDTHYDDYLNTSEGKYLPVKHCIKGTEGWELSSELKPLCERLNSKVYEKSTFGCIKLAEDLNIINKSEEIDSIELCGLCTDICVVSNALLIKANLTETPMYIQADCCAGVTPAKHEAALETMRSCQIVVK